ncbi:MAG: response regulator [Acidimicrobiia bacterium]|nr:response regulator [Acidimicrobiia bacterium]
MVVIIEDEPALAESVSFALETEGFRVRSADDGVDGIALIRRHRPALVLLDVMLPGLSGLDVCRQIRRDSDIPIIMLTARDSEADKVSGLELGADDYVTKPFSMRELMARVRSQIRRSTRTGQYADTNEVLRGGKITLDVDAHEVRVDNEMVELRPKEFKLLETLMHRTNRLSTREVLIDDVWGATYFGDTKTLDVHIKRLRHKLEKDPSNPERIVTVRGLGYKFVDDQ